MDSGVPSSGERANVAVRALEKKVRDLEERVAELERDAQYERDLAREQQERE